MTSVPNLKGFVFFPLISSQPGKPNHKLTILSQTFTSAEFATIQGTWEGDGPNVHDGTGDITTSFSLTPPQHSHGMRIESSSFPAPLSSGSHSSFPMA
jgi:hypothetical protein